MRGAEGNLRPYRDPRIVEPAFQRTVALAYAKAKGPSRAVTAVASQIVEIVGEMAKQGMWLAT